MTMKPGSISRRSFMALAAAAASIPLAGCDVAEAVKPKPLAEVKFKRAWRTTDWDGKPCLVVDYETTNRDASPASSEMTGYIEAKQKDKVLDTTNLSEEVEGYIKSATITQDESADGQTAFVLDNEESDVSLRCLVPTVDYSGDVELFSETVKLDDIENVAIALSCEIKDLTASLGRTGEGVTALLFTFSISNNTDETQSPTLLAELTAFQDGVELNEVYGSYDLSGADEALWDNDMREIQPGASIQVQRGFELSGSSRSDVEFKFEGWSGGVTQTIAGGKISLSGDAAEVSI